MRAHLSRKYRFSLNNREVLQIGYYNIFGTGNAVSFFSIDYPAKVTIEKVRSRVTILNCGMQRTRMTQLIL